MLKEQNIEKELLDGKEDNSEQTETKVHIYETLI